ncbi:hypothetical protein SAMN05421846_10128 [Chryseobacterium taeanense]|jgi:hypothetical protein|uniref:Lipoprotein n=1 Tax=Chryseobacterium taeanense TaxID=311334 RepID=A0A1G8D2Y2_9FLAO|nr:hypothetical protein [Chryseobacterium taeanense]SDH52096.1 hypothetical protein SAMN05421846_10128 [Chryseobacterium taeanense]
MKNVICLSVLCVTLALSSCSKEKTIDDDLKEVAANINKTTPQNLADGVRLDSVSAQPGKIFKYNYTLTDDVKESVTPEQIEAFKASAKEGALRVVKTSPDIKEFRDNDVTMVYTYYDKNGKPTTDFKITPEEYKGK